MSRLLFLIFLLLCNIVAMAQTWLPDILGGNYYNTEIRMPDDYSGEVKTTIIRQKCNFESKKAILYVHGYNDYFFQKELGDKFVNNGYNFYAIDLRKYGRSIMPGQIMFEVRSVEEYFEDLRAAFEVIVNDGNDSILLMGHSTGGLITSYYMSVTGGDDYPITALILNSPFLDMNLDVATEDYLLPTVCLCANLFPDLAISQGGGNMYARTLHMSYGGEWDYNFKWKTEWSQDVTLGWLKAITQAQDRLHRGADITMPILLMHSDWSGSEVDMLYEEAATADIVLDVDEISKYGKRLGRDVTEYVVKNGMHDLFLSHIPVRYSLYTHMFEWLEIRRGCKLNCVSKE